MSENQKFDVVIIGGGPAGYVGAIRAAQLGLRVACIERDLLGGVCNNWGCIPTKTLLAGAELYSKMKHEADAWGFKLDNLSHDWSKVIGRSRSVAELGPKGIAGLFKKNKIKHIEGHAQIVKTGTKSGEVVIDIHKAPGEVSQTLYTKNVLIATGARARGLPDADFDGEKIISYKEAMNLPEQPEKLLIVGAGAIGMEFAYFYNAFGTKVTVVEMLDRLLPIEDLEVSRGIAKAFKKQGIEIRTGHKTLKVEKTDTGIKAHIAPTDQPDKVETIEADKVLVAIGVEGRFDGLFADSVKPETFKGHLKVDKQTYQTNLPGVYAVGDVIGPPWLAHVASEEAVVCIEQIAGEKPTPIDYDAIPGCTYCSPQVASVGLTEQQCKDQEIEYNVGKFPFLASGKARALGETEGFVKIITGKQHGEVIGCHMIGDHVTELIAEIGLAIRLEATADEIIDTIHAHPTLSEAVHEAALGTENRMLHY